MTARLRVVQLHLPRVIARFEERRFGLLLMLPAAVLLIGLTAYPLIYLVLLSLQNVSLINILQPNHALVGLDNFGQVVSDPDFASAIGTTVAFTAASWIVQLSIGLVLGLLFSLQFRAKKWLLVVMMVPMLMTPVVIGLFWKLILNGEWGAANYFLSLLGLPGQSWLVDPNLALPSVIAVYSWGGISFVILVVVGAVTSQSMDLYEAARVDGASDTQTLRFITLPLLKPMLLVISMILLIDAVKTFDIMYVLTGGGPGGLTRVFALEVYDRAFNRTQYSQAAAEALMLVGVTLFLVSGLVVALRRASEE
jgi:multiple sugar transport system permease protein